MEKSKAAQEGDHISYSVIKPPTIAEIREVSEEVGLRWEEDELRNVQKAITPTFRNFQIVQQLADFVPRVKYPRTPGYQPDSDENKYNAWYVKTDIQGAPNGKLSGKKVAIKDAICVAGVPMMAGSSNVEGYTPDVDATVVERILDAGGRILGKAVCEDFCGSGGSHTAARGPVPNPRNPKYNVGGSSSGSAALVASGEVDMSLGGDQAGSIRIPAAYAGIYGLKPTYGLVPYSGIAGLCHSYDHTGPMTANTLDNALLLEAIAGPDGLDVQRQITPYEFPSQFATQSPRPPPQSNDYTSSIANGIRGKKIAVLKEGLRDCEPAVTDAFNNAVKILKNLGAVVEEVSVPMHVLGWALWGAVGMGSAEFQERMGDGHGVGYKKLYVTSFINHCNNVRKEKKNSISDEARLLLLLAALIQKNHKNYFHAKGSNLVRKLSLKYDEILSQFDFIVMPTLPKCADELPTDTASLEDRLARSWGMITNTCNFNLTGHPALSIPCGMNQLGLPVGLMVVGRHFSEAEIYKVSYAFENHSDWMDYVAKSKSSL